jgi:hypothetical protein
MSIEMQKAFESDMAVIREDNKPEYVDNDENASLDTPKVEDNKETPKTSKEPEVVIEPPVEKTRAKSKTSQEYEEISVDDFEQNNLFNNAKKV